MIALKPDPGGVRIRNPYVAMAILIAVVHEAYREMEVDAIVTSNGDGIHSHGSFHWMGFALDWRTRHLESDLHRQLVADRIKERLGTDYDVVLESDHLHTEWHPKGPVPITRRA